MSLIITLLSILSFVILSFAFFSNAECHYAECSGAQNTTNMKNLAYKLFSGWKPTHLIPAFALRAAVLLPDGTTLTAFADVNTEFAGC
jgi:hypothetical protein